MKRTLLVCVLAAALMAMMATAFAVPELYNVKLAGTDLIPKAPAFIDYQLNCTANITVEIYKWDNDTQTIGDKIRTDGPTSMSKGSHTYLWPCIKDGGIPADPGYYVAKITAAASPTTFSQIIGAYKFSDPTNEDTSGYWNPGVPADGWGWWKADINTNPKSDYYGRIYAANVNTGEIYMYDCDGSYLSTFNRSGIGWGSSAPWCVGVGQDGYVYVSDRSNTRIYCFTPDGSSYVLTMDATFTYFDVAQPDANVNGIADDPTYIFQSSGGVVWVLTVAADHASYTSATACNPTDAVFGVYVAPDLSYLFICEAGGVVRKWVKGTGLTYSRSGTWSCSVPAACWDVCESTDRTYLWIARYVTSGLDPVAKFWTEAGNSTNPTWAVSTAYTKGQVVIPTIPNTLKYVCIVAGTSDPVTEPTWPLTPNATVVDGTVTWQEASPIYYSGTAPTYMKGVAADAVGNVLLTYGKGSSSWPSYYWSLATEAGTYSTTKQADRPFEVFSDSAPVVVPGSATWTYSDVSGKLLPDDTSTAKVDFKVLDANGYSDIGSVWVNPSSLRMQSDAGTLVAADSIVQDTSDTNNLTSLCRATFKAVLGARAGVHTDLVIEPRDLDYPTIPSNTDKFSVDVKGNDFMGTVKHLSHLALISGATIEIVGGTDGVYGYPFTYTSDATDDNGIAHANISDGLFTAQALKVGYQEQTPSSFTMTGGPTSRVVSLGPITIAKAKTLLSGTLASIAGVCYAQPKGLAPTAADGLDYRLQAVVSETVSTISNQWYMCDAGDPENGMLFMLRITADPDYPYTWDDPGKTDEWGVPVYIGARPAEGRVIWVKGTVDYIPTYEKKCVVQDLDFLAEFGTEPQTFYQTYWNKASGVVPTPASKTVAQVYHGVSPPSGAPATWGSFVEVTGATVVAWLPGAGEIPVGAYFPALGEEAIDTAIIMDNSMNWATVTFQTLTSLNFWDGIGDKPAPVGLRDVYTIKGAGGRRARTGVGTIRPRKTADIVRTTDNPSAPPSDNIGSVRGAAANDLDLAGIVTAKFTDYMYVESADRSSGVRVIADAAAQTLVAVGDRIWFTGDSLLLDGQKQITPDLPFSIVTRGNALPYLGMRTRDIGGHSYGTYDPGVDQAFGALNVGLLLKVHGILTYKDTAAIPTYFYIWDGVNRTVAPVNDGNANSAWGIRINSAPTTAMTPWTSWIEVTGVVSVNQTAVVSATIPEIIPSVTPVILVASDFTTVSFPAGTILAGKNLIGVPDTPGNVGNGDSYGFDQGYDPVAVLSPSTDPDWYTRAEAIDGRIIRWDAGTLSSKGFEMWSEPHGEFGGITLGDGYWVTADSAWTTCSYKARVQNIPQWISPASATNILIANPQNHDVELDPVNLDPPQAWDTGVMMSDGAQVLSFAGACTYGAGWIGSTGTWWDNAAGSSRDTGVVDDWAYDTRLLAWHGYWFTWLQNYKSMIVP